MLNNNHVLTGVALGFLIPFVSYAVLLMIYEQLDASGIISDTGLTETFRKRTMCLLAVCFNLIPFSIFNAKKHQESMRGISIPTVIYVMVWVFYFRDSIL